MHVQTFIRRGLPGAALLLLYEICPAGEDKTRFALAVAVQTVASAIQHMAVESCKQQSSSPLSSGASPISRCNVTCASAILFLSLAGGNISTFSKTISIMKYWAATCASPAGEGQSISSSHVVNLAVICSAVTDDDTNDAQVVARWLSDAVIEDARECRLTSVTQSSIWCHVVEWTQVTGCFVCQRALEQLIAAGDWGRLMHAAHECSIHPQVIMSFTSACAPDSVQKTCVAQPPMFSFPRHFFSFLRACNAVSRYVLLFLQGLCNDSTALSSKFSYGISTSYEGVVVASNEVDGISGPALLEMVKDIRNIASPLMSLLRLALEHSTPCAAGFATKSSRFCFLLLDSFLPPVFAAAHDCGHVVACASVYLKACRSVALFALLSRSYTSRAGGTSNSTRFIPVILRRNATSRNLLMFLSFSRMC